MTTEQQDTSIVAKLVCVGMVIINDKSHQGWIEIQENGTLANRVRGWSKPLVKYAGVGQVYTVHLTRGEDDTISVIMGGARGPQYAERYADDEQVARWRLASEAVEATLRREKRAKDDKAENALKDLLEPIRAQYRATDYTGRRAILATVMEYITR